MIQTLFECQAGSKAAKTHIQYQVGTIGRDWIILITGGESHIGSITCSDKTLNEKYSFTLAHHKEDAIVTEAYKHLSHLVENEVIVISGIHYHQITSNQIKIILKNNQELIHQTADFLVHNPTF